jgi:hypothetical protein
MVTVIDAVDADTLATSRASPVSYFQHMKIVRADASAERLQTVDLCSTVRSRAQARWPGSKLVMVLDSPASLEDSEEAYGARASLASRPSMPGSVRRRVVSRGGAVSRLSV